jgi:hypothetical protein
VTANGQLTMADGIALTGPGTLAIGPTGTSTFAGSYFYLGGNLTLRNEGSFTLDGAGTQTIYDNGGTNLFANVGTLNLVGAATNSQYASISVPLDNDGTVNATGAATHYLSGAVTGSTGTFAIGSGSALQPPDLNLSNVTVSGAGTLRVQGTTLSGTGSVPNLSLGWPTITGTVTVTSSLTIDDQTVLSGPGGTSTGTLITAPATTTTFAGSYFYLGGNLTLRNEGSFTLDGAGTQTIYDNGGTNLFANVGTLVYSPVSSTGVLSVGMPLSNSGILQATKGSIDLGTLTNLSGSGALTGGGTYSATNGVLRFANAVTSNSATIIVSATGNVVIGSGTTGALNTLATNSGSLTIGRSVTATSALTNSGTVEITGGTYRPTAYTQTARATTIATGAVLRAGSAGTGAVTISAGSLAGGGTIQGNLSVGSASLIPGGVGNPLSVWGTFGLAGGSTFQAAVNGATTAGTDYAKVTTTGAATIGGALAITTGASYNPPVGTSIRIIEAPSRSGTFATVTGVDIPGNKHWVVGYDATGATLTVAANPNLSVNDVSIVEGNTGSTNAMFTVALDAPTDRAVSVDFTTSAGTATASTDYSSTSGTVSIAAGSTMATISVPVLGDTIFEPDETFTVVLSAIVSGVLADGIGLGTITNDDPEPPVTSVTAISPSSIGQGATSVPVTITGSAFTPGSTVAISGTGVTISGVTVVSDTQITGSVSVNGTTATSARSITVSTANGSATCSGCLTLAPRPVVSSTTPALGQGAKLRELTITGTNFQPGAKISISGATVSSTSYVNSTTLEAVVTVTPTRAIGAYAVTATNPDKGKFVCLMCFTVVAGPKLTSMTPSTAARGATYSVTVTGSGFVAGAKLTGPAGVTFDAVVVTNASTITAEMTIIPTMSTGAKAIVVTNPASAGFGSFYSSILTVTT